MLSTYNNLKSTLLAFGCLYGSKVKVAVCSIYVGLPQLLALEHASPLEIVQIPSLYLFLLNSEGGREMHCCHQCTPGVLSVVDWRHLPVVYAWLPALLSIMNQILVSM